MTITRLPPLEPPLMSIPTPPVPKLDGSTIDGGASLMGVGSGATGGAGGGMRSGGGGGAATRGGLFRPSAKDGPATAAAPNESTSTAARRREIRIMTGVRCIRRAVRQVNTGEVNSKSPTGGKQDALRGSSNG